MLFHWPLPRQIRFTFSLNDVAHGYGDRTPCHSLCAGVHHVTAGDQHYSFHLAALPVCAPPKCQAAGLLLSILNCTIGISASGYISIRRPTSRGQSPRLLYPASPGSALTAQPDAVPAQANASRIMRIVQRLREATKVMNRGRRLHRGHSCSTGKPVSRTTTIACGRGNVIPNFCQLRVYKLSSSTFIGLP